MDLVLFGTSHKTAPVDVREAFKLSADEIRSFLVDLVAIDGVYEAACVSTCNRTEIYTATEDIFDPTLIKDVLAALKNSKIEDDHFYTMRNSEVARHLFCVSSGLESQMVGETQIKAQVKEAYTLSCEARTNGAYLNRLFHMAFKAGKAVRAETNLGRGAVSVSSAAVELASHIYESLDGRSALLIGAGETGELVAKHLLERGAASLKITNRTAANAEILAKKYNATTAPFDSLPKVFFESDIVISTTASPDYILTKARLAPYAKEKSSKRVMVIDIAVPRDIDPALSEYDNIFLYDIDDLETVVNKNLEVRKGEIPHAEKIIESATREYHKWFKEQRVVPTIKYLKEKFENIRRAELDKKHPCSSCSKRGEVDFITKRIINKILSAPITNLVQNTDCTEEELNYLRNIFDREDASAEKNSDRL